MAGLLFEVCLYLSKNIVGRIVLSVGSTVRSEVCSIYVQHLCWNSTGSAGGRTKSAWASLIIQLNQYERRGNVTYRGKNLMRMFHLTELEKF